jgi:lipoic acid synthetase
MEVRRQNPTTKIEVLIPDFNVNKNHIDIVLASNPDIVAHNIETVERLTPSVRSRASYKKSLEVVAHVAKKGYLSKSGIMVGLGEEKHEVEQALTDLRAVGCRAITIGQYLQPRGENLPVSKYIEPEVFELYKSMASSLGFDFVESGPLVRSSYHAEETAKRGKGGHSN